VVIVKKPEAVVPSSSVPTNENSISPAGSAFATVLSAQLIPTATPNARETAAMFLANLDMWAIPVFC
jgi:hypothetical protein